MVFGNRTTQVSEVVDLVDALELQLVQKKPDEFSDKITILDYEIVAFEETYFDLNIFFNDIPISENGMMDELVLTFHGT